MVPGFLFERTLLISESEGVDSNKSIEDEAVGCTVEFDDLATVAAAVNTAADDDVDDDDGVDVADFGAIFPNISVSAFELEKIRGLPVIRYSGMSI